MEPRNERVNERRREEKRREEKGKGQARGRKEFPREPHSNTIHTH